ncbi:spherulin-2A-like [Leptidea sinapis]|uniref:spherulin-2A-like n=1 Tax=Leptidea sinapis TaxID=189913 RepID=UPI002131D895|nr:spherulin-2A-like [Leptidea sinapis]
MAFRVFLLVLPALALANIEIDLSGTIDKNPKLDFSGQEVDIISDSERQLFQLSDSNLKQGVSAYFGGSPDDVYLKSPTPWGDLFKSYGWHQVARTLAPKSGKILSVSSQPQIVLKQYFENNSSKPAMFNVGISQAVQNTMKSSWSKSDGYTIGSEINYGFDIEFAKVGGKTSFNFTSAWGSTKEKSETVTVGSTSQMQVLLQPGQSVVAELQATRGALKVQMEYEATLSGALATNYNTPHKGHHFWGLDVNSVMSHAGLERTKMSTQYIEVAFFSNSQVIVYDKKSKLRIMKVDF